MLDLRRDAAVAELKALRDDLAVAGRILVVVENARQEEEAKHGR